MVPDLNQTPGPLYYIFCSCSCRLLQVPPGRGQSSPPETGPARHGEAPETLAVQTPGQPVPHQDGEGAARPGLPHDPGPGETTWGGGGKDCLTTWSWSIPFSV